MWLGSFFTGYTHISLAKLHRQSSSLWKGELLFSPFLTKKHTLTHASKSTAERQFSSIYLHTVPLRHALLHPLMNTYRLTHTHTTNRVGLMNDRVLCLLGTFKLVNIIGLYCISVSLEQKSQPQNDLSALTKFRPDSWKLCFTEI